MHIRAAVDVTRVVYNERVVTYGSLFGGLYEPECEIE